MEYLKKVNIKLKFLELSKHYKCILEVYDKKGMILE